MASASWNYYSILLFGYVSKLFYLRIVNAMWLLSNTGIYFISDDSSEAAGNLMKRRGGWLAVAVLLSTILLSVSSLYSLIWLTIVNHCIYSLGKSDSVYFSDMADAWWNDVAVYDDTSYSFKPLIEADYKLI